MWYLAPAPIRLHCWDDACVLYHTASAETHQITHGAAKILDSLQHAPASSIAIAAALFPELSADALQQVLSETEYHLNHFAHLGLVVQLTD